MMKRLLLSCALVLAVPHVAWADGPAVAATVRERALAVDGVRNFRDVGGYRTSEGRTVRWGRLYRSGSLGDLTAQGMTQLDRMGIAAIIDLRTTEERGRDRTNWLPLSGHGYWARDYGFSTGDMAAVFGKRTALTADSVRTMMKGAYGAMAVEQAPAYRQLFARLLAADGGVIVNCTAGKDRTGIAAALVLTALGVPYETVREDFLLSNGARGMGGLQAALSGPLAQLPPDVAAPLLGVEGEYLDTAFARLRQDYGSVEGFLDRELGVGQREIAALRQRMLD